MICSKSKEEIAKSREQSDLESLLLEGNRSRKLRNANGIKAMHNILIHSDRNKDYLNRVQEIQFREPSADTK